MISHASFISFQLHLLDVHDLHFHPLFQGFYLFTQINQTNVVYPFFFCCCKLPCCILFSFLAENIEPFLRMLIISSASFAVSFSATASSASWLNMLRHSSECSFSFPSFWAASDIFSNSSFLTVSANCSSIVAASATQISASFWENGRNT
jgi:hypothetical protein